MKFVCKLVTNDSLSRFELKRGTDETIGNRMMLSTVDFIPIFRLN
jgi:hypothetical protein